MVKGRVVIHILIGSRRLYATAGAVSRRRIPQPYERAATARVADLEPPQRGGLYMGLYSATWSAAFAFGPWLGMGSFTRLGPQLHWVVVGGAGLIAAALFGSQPDKNATPAAAG